MIVNKTIDDVRKTINEFKKHRQKIGFVPTMGALHEGHFSLIKQARNHCDVVVVSIFVNPQQFGPNEDFESYPRNLEEDLAKCRNLDIDAVFTPDREMMYPDINYFSIKINKLNNHMCGASRPGFFEGVVLVVNKLFNIIEPDIAVFGQKDIQQFLILNQMVREFNHRVTLEMGPIIRANDGLALSSRNVYLSDEERKIAPGLFRSLTYIEKQIKNGIDQPELLINHQKNELEAKGFKIDYLSVYLKKTLEPVSSLLKGEEYIIAGAVYLGRTRLIDNIIFKY
ncbi:MAG: pantoate--beta-alanine ligase [Balneolaceae bacterium]